MQNIELPVKIRQRYNSFKNEIRKRLKELEAKNDIDIFYELCYCLCTPQSQAKNAFAVESILREKNFFLKSFNPNEILRDANHYIRFHNQKTKNLLEAKNQFSRILNLLMEEISANDKRLWLYRNIKGLGMKECSHFLRNIGYRGLAILDRHILKHLVLCGVYDEIPKITSITKYLEVETKFIILSKKVGINIDELDLLFWSYETGEILK